MISVNIHSKSETEHVNYRARSSRAFHTPLQAPFLMFSSWRNLIEIGATEKNFFKRFYLFVFCLFQWFKSSFERSKTWLKRKFSFWESRIWREQFLLDLGFWLSVDKAWKQFFPKQNRFICIPEKDGKNQTFWWRKFGALFSFHYVWFWFPFYFNLFLLHSFLVRPRWGWDRSTRMSSGCFEFLKIIAYEISIDLVLLGCKSFWFLLPRIWIFFWFYCQELQEFSWIFSTILKNLANLAKNDCQDIGEKCQKSKNFLGKKPRRQALGLYSWVKSSINSKSNFGPRVELFWENAAIFPV